MMKMFIVIITCNQVKFHIKLPTFRKMYFEEKYSQFEIPVHVL